MPAQFNTGLPATTELSLQCCASCNHINYPKRELCGNCLADELCWQPVNGAGTVQSFTDLHYPLEDNFSKNLPWRVGSIMLDAGPVTLAHLQPGLNCNDRVKLSIAKDQSNNYMLVATGEGHVARDWLGSINFTEATS